MATPDDLRAQIAEINGALADPARQVTLGSQNITYRTVEDLLKARKALLDDLAAIETPETLGRRSFFAVYSGRGTD